MMISEKRFDAAVREVKAALRGKVEAHIIDKKSGSGWHPAVIVSKRSLRVLLEIASKAEVM